MEQLLLIALIGTCTATMLGALRKDLALVCGIATAVLLLFAGLKHAALVQETVEKLTEAYGIPSALLAALMKIIGLSYLTEFGVNICRDAGQTAIAGNLEFGGKALILACALPALVSLIEIGVSLIGEAGA